MAYSILHPVIQHGLSAAVPSIYDAPVKDADDVSVQGQQLDAIGMLMSELLYSHILVLRQIAPPAFTAEIFAPNGIS